MKLSKVFDQTNFQEKGSFYKVLTNLIENSTSEEIDKSLARSNDKFKDLENDHISNHFEILMGDYQLYLELEMGSSISQLDILIDILIRDGNSVLRDSWFEELYIRQLNKLKDSSNQFIDFLETESKDHDNQRKRDYNIYRECVKIAYSNDEKNNLDNKVTHDEYSILRSLSHSLELSNEEIRLIHHSIVKPEVLDKEQLIKHLVKLGIVLYSKNKSNIYVPDEIVKVLRNIRGKSFADKYFRRLLTQFKDPIINAICKKHNISIRLEREHKIKNIINQGISVESILSNDIYKEPINVNDKKKELNAIMLTFGIDPKGVTLSDKIDIIINHFNSLEKDEKLGISIDGYSHLCNDLKEHLPELTSILTNEFEFREDTDILKSELLIDSNIKPRDILDLLSKDQLKTFCVELSIKTKGDLIDNIIENYTDSENIYIENYLNLGRRDLEALKNNKIQLTTAEIGIKYEEVTKRLLSDLRLNVDESLRESINTNKDKMDILINLGDKRVIIIECKTSKANEYNKFSNVMRQINAYEKIAQHEGLTVVKTLLIAPDFSEDFITECDLSDSVLSLMSSEVLLNIWNGFKQSKHATFPYNLFTKDTLISDIKILKALKVN